MTTSFNFQYWAFYVCCLCLCVGETFGRRDKKKADEVRSARQRAAVATAEYADDPIFSVHGAVRAMLPHCTWHSCFDISRCPDPSLQHSIFVYGGSRSLPAMPLKYITEDPLLCAHASFWHGSPFLFFTHPSWLRPCSTGGGTAPTTCSGTVQDLETNPFTNFLYLTTTLLYPLRILGKQCYSLAIFSSRSFAPTSMWQSL